MDEMTRRRVGDQQPPTASQRVDFASLPRAVQLRLSMATPGRSNRDQLRALLVRAPVSPMIPMQMSSVR